MFYATRLSAAASTGRQFAGMLPPPAGQPERPGDITGILFAPKSPGSYDYTDLCKWLKLKNEWG
jgi:hypothetical protein